MRICALPPNNPSHTFDRAETLSTREILSLNKQLKCFVAKRFPSGITSVEHAYEHYHVFVLLSEEDLYSKRSY